MSSCDGLVSKEDLQNSKLDADSSSEYVSSDNPTLTTRLGKIKKTVQGMNDDNQQAIDNFNYEKAVLFDDFQDAADDLIYSTGFINEGLFSVPDSVSSAQGTLTFDSGSGVGEEWAVTALSYPYTPNTTSPYTDTAGGTWRNVTLEARKTVARSLNVKDSEVIYHDDTVTVLDDVLYIYDKSVNQSIWSKPSDLPVGAVIVSVVGSQLTYNPGGVTVELTFDKPNSYYLPLAGAVKSTTLSIGDEVFVVDRGFGRFEIVDSATVTPNGYNIIAMDNSDLALVLDKSKGITSENYGVVADGSDQFPAMSALIQSGGKITIGNGNIGLDLLSNVALYAVDNSEIHLSPNTSITALQGALDSVSVFRVWNNKNVKIYGNGGEVVGDNDTHPTASEKAHGVYILESEDVEVVGVKSRNWQGDGIYVGAGSTPCKNITLGKNDCRDNSRQGISLTYVDGFLLYKNKLSESGVTNGAAPMAGLDLEPNAGQFVKNGIVIQNEIRDNVMGGILVQGSGDGTEDVVFEKNISESNGSTWGGMLVTNCLRIHTHYNTFRSNLSWGLQYKSSSSFCDAIGNTAESNATDGFVGLSSTRLSFRSNKSLSNTDNGFSFTAVNNSDIEDNTSYDNTKSGYFMLTQFNNNNISNNFSELNGETGYTLFDRCSGNIVRGNRSKKDGQTTDNTYAAYRLGVTVTDNDFLHNKVDEEVITNQVKYGLQIENADCDNNYWEGNEFTGKTNPVFMNFLTPQRGKKTIVNIGSLGAGSSTAFCLGSVSGKNGSFLVSAAVVDVSGIAVDPTDYTSLSLQGRSLAGTVSTDLTTPLSTNATAISPYNKTEITPKFNSDAIVLADDVITVTKIDSGAGKPITNMSVEFECLEF